SACHSLCLRRAGATLRPSLSFVSLGAYHPHTENQQQYTNMGTIIFLVILVCIIVVIVNKFSASSTSGAATQPISRPSIPPPLPELSDAELARKAVDTLGAVNDPPERVRDLWRAGRFEPLNLAKQALKKD